MRLITTIDAPEVRVNGQRVYNEGTLDFVGSVSKFAIDNAPAGWLRCDGSAVSRTEYAELFAVIGTKHGEGDGSTTFNLPNLLPKRVLVTDSGEPYTFNGDMIWFGANSSFDDLVSFIKF